MLHLLVEEMQVNTNKKKNHIKQTQTRQGMNKERHLRKGQKRVREHLADQKHSTSL